MKRSSKSKIRNSKQNQNPNRRILFEICYSNLLRILNFEVRILSAAFAFVSLTVYSATNGSSADDDLAKLRPPRAELPPSFWEKYELWLILGSILVLALIAAIVWIATRPKPPIIIPPEVRAKQVLNSLLNKPEDGLVLSQVSQVLRHYVTEAFALPPGELTTAEFSRLLANDESVGFELGGAVSDFLRQCDEKKFTASPPPVPLDAVATALKLIETAQARRANLRRQTNQASAA